MRVFVLVVLLIILCYCGEIFGLLMQCEQIKSLHKMKRFVWLIPFLKYGFALDSLKKGRILDKIRFLVNYLRMKQKNFVFMYCMAVCLEELQKEGMHQKTKRKTKEEQTRQCVLSAKLKMESYCGCVPVQ